ncbi:hypothetical protein LY76DRAFT_525343 [Colletotrichum caudatum]|nr:hypothetical protein LY76DRAFT_525343 [Colletotrichum caudatum]
MSESSAATASSPRKKKAAPAPQSVNHTEYAPLTTSPITVSIETKKPGGSEDEANAQLAVWVSAHFLRLQQLLVDRPVNITLPLLYVSGSTWQVLYAINKGNNIEILRSTRFDGATSTILGCYKVVAVLRALRAWSETVFREWFLDAFVPERRKAS